MKAITRRIERAIEKHKQATDKQIGLEIEIATQKGLTRAVMSSNAALRRALEKACEYLLGACPPIEHARCHDDETGWAKEFGEDKCRECFMQYFMEKNNG